jgi:hypothetical protein
MATENFITTKYTFLTKEGADAREIEMREGEGGREDRPRRSWHQDIFL